MAFSDFRIIFPRADFTALRGPVPLELVKAKLIALPLASPIVDIRAVPGDGVSVEWASLISPADHESVRRAVTEFEGRPTTSEPFTVTNDEPVLAATSTAVSAIDFETPPLDAGKYQVLWLTEHRLTAAASGTASRASFMLDEVSQSDHCQRELARAFNGATTIERKLGERIHVRITVAKVGPGAVSAQMTSARLTIDKLG